MCRVRHIMSNGMQNLINSLNVTEDVRLELVQLYRFNSWVAEEVIRYIVGINFIISHIDIVIDNGIVTDINCFA